MAEAAVSVIIPNFNHAKYLEKRIDSVLSQTYTNFEVIILDDFSTDYSREIIERYRGHTKITDIIFNTVNSGSTFKQWQKGIECARGKYVWIAESDDYANKDFLEEMVGKLDAHPEAGLAYCQSYQVDENDAILANCKDWYPERWNHDFCNKGMRELEDHFLFSGIVNASAAVFKKEIALQADRSYIQFRYAGDWYFWINFLLRSDICYVAKELNYFRLHNENVSNNAKKTGTGINESLMVLRKIKPYFSEKARFHQKYDDLINAWARALARFRATPFAVHRKILSNILAIDSSGTGRIMKAIKKLILHKYGTAQAQ